MEPANVSVTGAPVPRPQVFGEYLLLEKLGAGAMGDVFLARTGAWSGFPPLVVIKRLHAELTAQPELVKRFAHEARITASLVHPNLMRVFDAGQVAQTLYLAAELIPGASLADLIAEASRRKIALPVGVAAALVRDAALGLAALHAAVDPQDGRPLMAVHRDVSPRNAIVDPGGVCRVIDLGLLKSTVQDWKTSTGVVMGSPGYMAPEQAMGINVTQAADVYGLGAVLFEMISGERLVATQGTLLETLLATASPKLRPAGASRTDVPAALEALLQSALSLDATARPTAAVLAAGLSKYAAPPGEVAQLGRSLLGAAWSERQVRYERWAREVAPAPEPTEHTNVFVRVQLAPPPFIVGPGGMPEAPPMLVPPGAGPPVAANSPWRAIGVGAAIALSFGLGIVVIGVPREAEIVVVPAAPRPPPPPIKMPEPKPPAQLAPPPPDPPKPEVARPAKKPIEPPAPEVAAPPAIDELAEVRAKIMALRTRATALQAKLEKGSPEASALDSLVWQLLLESERADARKAKQTVAELERSLSRLEAGR